jgi:two-component system sensor kinase
VARVSAEGSILYRNPAAAELPGWACEVGKPLPDLLRPLLGQAMKEEKEVQQDTELGGRYYSVSVTPFPAERYSNTYGLDITERKRAEEALKEAHDQLQDHADRLEAANKELESFGYSVSHDLRAPLRAIAGFTRMILDEKGSAFDPETRRKFGVIQENAEKMGQLIDDLLRLSRLGRAELHRSKLDMGGLVHEVIQEIRMTEPEREWVTEIGDLPAAHGDRVMIRQLLANLLSNAVKFTRGRQGARIEVGSLEKSGERVYYVKDNGVGFDMKYYNKLFGVFQRLVSESQFEGTGVGLAIVQRIVQRHGGRVWAEGQIREGATFYFTLPPKEQG